MAETSPSLDPQLLDRNLDALRRSQPDVAAQLLAARTPIPEATPAPTRDGQINFRIRQLDGRETWFGRTSIPRVRAAALIDVFQAGQANVLLPGIAEGSEAELLLRRLAPHQAVFVWENDPVNLLLALRLHDFSAAIESRRLVLVLADEANSTTGKACATGGLSASADEANCATGGLSASADEANCATGGLSASADTGGQAARGTRPNALAEVLHKMSGHLCPERILLWPWQTQTGISACKFAVEAAFREIERERQTQLASIRDRLARLPGRGDASASPDLSPAVALFSIHTRHETWAWADALTEAGSQSGWRMASVVVRTPAEVHPLARATRLASGLDRAPDFALLLDVCRADIADVLPARVPAINWLSHEPASEAPLLNRIGEADRVLATSSMLAERLAADGLDSTRLSVCPLPLLATCEEPPEWADRPIDVAVVANYAPADPQTHGFELPSHVSIWNAALEQVRSNLDDFTDARLPALLERAESKVRVRIEDPKTRRRMSDALGGPAASSLIWQNLTQALSRSGLTMTCYGFGWPDMAGLSVVRKVSDPAGRLQFYHQAKCVLFAAPTGAVGPDVLLAAEAGAAVFWRSHPNDTRPGGLATLLTPGEEAVFFSRNTTLVPTLRKLLGDSAAWRRIVTAARRRCRSEHSPAAALARVQAVATSFLSSR